VQGSEVGKRIFIASATGHLVGYRAAAIEVCHRLWLTPVFMEDFAAESPPPLAVCRRKIDSCGAVILLVGHRYGSRPPGETLGYTELEYEYAVQCGKQLHVFRVEEGFPWPPPDVDRGGDAVALARFVKRVGVHTVRRFGDLARFREDLMLTLQPYARVTLSGSGVGEAGDVRWPLQVGSIPLLADCYQHRGRETGLIGDAVAPGRTTVLTQVLSGLGGVGKTQLAAGYAHAAWRDAAVELVMWVTASSREAIQASYAQAAREIATSVPVEAEQSAVWFLGWLQTTHRPWLIVLDDLGDPADVQGLWPVGPEGRCLVTTRRRDTVLAGGGRKVIEVGLYTPQEAVGYLQEKLAGVGGGEPEGEVVALAEELEYLPLALAQAASFILDRRETVAGYRRRLRDRRRRLGQLFPADALADDYRSTVAATWAMSVQRADQLAPVGVAGAVLELVSVLDPNGVPMEVAMAPAAVRFLTDHRRGGRSPSPVEDVDGVECRDALANLHRLNVVSVDPCGGARAIRTHALVQRATLEHRPRGVICAAVAAAADALVQVWPEVERDTELGRALRENAARLTDRYPELLWDPQGHPVLFRAGRSLGECGLVNAAVAYWKDMATKADDLLGPDHPHTLITRSNIARWRGEAGDPGGAVSAFEQLLPDRLRVLGPDHRGTLSTRSNIAWWRGEAGDPGGAVSAFEQLLPDRLRVLGPDHRDTLSTRSNIARWRGQAGDPGGAVSAFEQLLPDQLRVLGPDHPDTLSTRSNIAHWRGQAGDPGGAVTAYEQLLPDQLRVLGPDHPDTLRTRSNIAYWRGQAGDPGGAGTAYEQLLPDALRVLGPDHPDTLRTRSNIAYWRGQAGDPGGAGTAFEQLLPDRLRVLGPDHPDTLGTRSNIAYWRGQAGDPGGAVTAFEQLLTDQLRILGPDHPHTLTTRAHLAHWRKQTHHDLPKV
jgi:Domain of unknown function (DUF4062)/NB-ARC domain/Tetratricopeptide repeat